MTELTLELYTIALERADNAKERDYIAKDLIYKLNIAYAKAHDAQLIVDQCNRNCVELESKLAEHITSIMEVEK